MTVRLNLGSGDDHRDGYTSVDLRPDVADTVADVRDLPFPDSTAEEILALDILEHLPPCHTEATLAEWRRVLAPGGKLTVRVPNLYQLCRALYGCYEAGMHDRVLLVVANLYGGHKFGPEGSLDRHEWGWTPAAFDRLLAGCGFDVLSNDEALNMTVEAKVR